MPRISVSTARNWGAGVPLVAGALGYTALTAGIGVVALGAYLFILRRHTRAVEQALRETHQGHPPQH